MIKKVGILTFHAAHNYGSMLQAYALQSYIRSLEVEAEEINLRVDAQKRMYANPLKFWGPRSILARIRNPRREFGRIQKWYKYEHFLNSYIHHTDKEFHSWNEIDELLPDLGYDAIICGGDQIWNTYCHDFSEAYFLPSALNGIKKISYSPSLGGDLTRLEDLKTKEFIKNNLAYFDVLSVRDYAGQQYLEGLLGRSVPVIPDPTFLLTANEWERIIPQKRIIKGDYVLYYSPFSSKTKEELALRIGRLYNCPVITTNTEYHTDKRIIGYNNCGPLQFLNILKHARFVCGHSYHLAVFSLILHKDFLAFKGDTDARIVGLLASCGLDSCGISLDTNNILINPIDFVKTDKAISAMREQGQAYIKSVLEM